MMSLAILFPSINPVLMTLGPIEIRWYGLMYMAAILFAWWYANRIIHQDPLNVQQKHTGDFIAWVVIGVIVGGRLGFVLFYNLDYFLENPLEIIKTWQGGMSFHGGLIGVIAALYFFSHYHKINLLEFSDLLALTVPMGISFGRIGNFLNGEHWGRITEVSWGMIFPLAGPEARHPSQLYEAFLEGFLVFLVINIINQGWKWRRHYYGACSGLFAILYALARIISEYYRDPDGYIGSLTLGQAYSIPMIFVGGALIWYAFKHPTTHNPA